jgi:hypothetical protein
MPVIGYCCVIGCDAPAVRGITVCLFHEREYDTGDWPRTMDGWRVFLAAMGGDDRAR